MDACSERIFERGEEIFVAPHVLKGKLWQEISFNKTQGYCVIFLSYECFKLKSAIWAPT